MLRTNADILNYIQSHPKTTVGEMCDYLPHSLGTILDSVHYLLELDLVKVKSGKYSKT